MSWMNKSMKGEVASFQHLFFLMEVATEAGVDSEEAWESFQHLFFLMEVATSFQGWLNTSGLQAWFQHLFFLMEVATLVKRNGLPMLKYYVSTPFLPNGSRYPNARLILGDFKPHLVSTPFLPNGSRYNLLSELVGKSLLCFNTFSS